MPAFHPGEVIAQKYRVEQVLGEGGMGVVVLATHLELHERVAIKTLHDELARNPQVVERFLREGRSARRVRGAHVVEIMDVGRLDNGTPFLVMEYLNGQDLAQRLRQRGGMHLGEAVDFLLQACEAVAVAHAEGIVHRDLKPANLFVATARDGSPLVKVLDFGISKAQAGPVDALTATAGVMGSPSYMSPEHLRSAKKVDGRADLWALGVILFEMLTLQLPFADRSPATMMTKILREPPISLRQLRPDLPPAIEAIVGRALEKDRDRRYQTVAEFATALAPYGSALAAASAAVIARLAPSPQATAYAPPVAPQATAYAPPIAAPALPVDPNVPLLGAAPANAAWGGAVAPAPAGQHPLEATVAMNAGGGAPFAGAAAPMIPSFPGRGPVGDEPIAGVPRRGNAPLLIGLVVILAVAVGGVIFALSGRASSDGAGSSAQASTAADDSAASPGKKPSKKHETSKTEPTTNGEPSPSASSNEAPTVATASPTATATRPTASTAATSTTGTTAPPATATATTNPPPATDADKGTLFINTLPASACLVNGVPQGRTPITLAEPPGSYEVRCVTRDGDEALAKSTTASVTAGQKTTVVLKLRD
jgi:serine/threonine-protein kinase